MRHLNGNAKLSLPTDQRLALLKSLLRAVVKEGRIKTTLHRARATARLMDRCIELGKRSTLASQRQIFALLQDRTLVKKVCSDIAPRFQGQSGGYTRVLKVGTRLGDGATLALLTLTNAEVAAG